MNKLSSIDRPQLVPQFMGKGLSRRMLHPHLGCVFSCLHDQSMVAADSDVKLNGITSRAKFRQEPAGVQLPDAAAIIRTRFRLNWMNPCSNHERLNQIAESLTKHGPFVRHSSMPSCIPTSR